MNVRPRCRGRGPRERRRAPRLLDPRLQIRLFLFADRLELYSPGKLPNTMTLEEMPYRVFTRNQLLVNFLSRIHSRRTARVYLESRGEGVRAHPRGGEAHSAAARSTNSSVKNSASPSGQSALTHTSPSRPALGAFCRCGCIGLSPWADRAAEGAWAKDHDRWQGRDLSDRE